MRDHSLALAQCCAVWTRSVLSVRLSWHKPLFTERQRPLLKIDATDYSRSYTARDYVSYYTQRISSAGVYNGARGILKSIAYKHYKRRNPA